MQFDPIKDLTLQIVYEKAKKSYAKQNGAYFEALKTLFAEEGHNLLARAFEEIYCAGYVMSFAENVGNDVIPSVG